MDFAIRYRLDEPISSLNDVFFFFSVLFISIEHFPRAKSDGPDHPIWGCMVCLYPIERLELYGLVICQEKTCEPGHAIIDIIMIYPSLVLVQPRKTSPCLTKRLLMARKESYQTNKTKKNNLFRPLSLVGNLINRTMGSVYGG